MKFNIEELTQSVKHERDQLLYHPLYKDLISLKDFTVFMECHVFAVWDFMSLLKSLQQKLTGSSVPWLPAKNPLITRLINDIVLAEESDEDGKGGFCSHFELYLKAMQEAGASDHAITVFLKNLEKGASVEESITKAELPDFIGQFIYVNYRMAMFGKVHEVAASFTLGRENLIPDLFRKLIDELVKNQPKELATLSYYFDRHVHLDEEEHGPLAWKMIALLIGEDKTKFEEAVYAAKEALNIRKILWDGIHQTILQRKTIVK